MGHNRILFLNDFRELKERSDVRKNKVNDHRKRNTLHIDLTSEEFELLGVLADLSFTSRSSIVHEMISEFTGMLGAYLDHENADVVFLHMQLVGMNE